MLARYEIDRLRAALAKANSPVWPQFNEAKTDDDQIVLDLPVRSWNELVSRVEALERKGERP